MSEEQKNPHYVTPEEATKRDCAMKPDMYLCNGPKCMAWRWATEREEKIRSDGLKQFAEYSTTHGYCGMVRHG